MISLLAENANFLHDISYGNYLSNWKGTPVSDTPLVNTLIILHFSVNLLLQSSCAVDYSSTAPSLELAQDKKR